MTTRNNEIKTDLSQKSEIKKIREDIRKNINNSREKLRELIFEIAKEYGGSALHYNELIDDIYSQDFGELIEKK
ncbi:MAG: hypothetical protein ACQEQF_12925 [Bacillota bacterium]